MWSVPMACPMCQWHRKQTPPEDHQLGVVRREQHRGEVPGCLCLPLGRYLLHHNAARKGQNSVVFFECSLVVKGWFNSGFIVLNNGYMVYSGYILGI